MSKKLLIATVAALLTFFAVKSTATTSNDRQIQAKTIKNGSAVLTLPTSTGTIPLTTQNIATATALASNPTDCSSGQKATAIDASGNLTCSAVSMTADVSGVLPIANGGTNASTKAGAFDSLSPMTTAGDIIIGGASGTGTRLAVGTSGQVLSVSGGAPSWQNATGITVGFGTATHGTDCVWSTTSTSFANPSDDASCTFTKTSDTNLTLAVVGSTSPGVTWTPDRARDYHVCAAVAVNNNGSQATTVRLVDGSGTELTGPSVGVWYDSSGNTMGQVFICGNINAPNTSALTVKVQIAATSGANAARIQTPNSGANLVLPIKWSVITIN